jgi:hypothetical protein
MNKNSCCTAPTPQQVEPCIGARRARVLGAFLDSPRRHSPTIESYTQWHGANRSVQRVHSRRSRFLSAGLSHWRPPIPAFLGTFPFAGLACGKALEEVRIKCLTL